MSGGLPTVRQDLIGVTGALPTVQRDLIGTSGALPTVWRGLIGASGALPTVWRDLIGASGALPTVWRDLIGVSGALATVWRDLIGVHASPAPGLARPGRRKGLEKIAGREQRKAKADDLSRDRVLSFLSKVPGADPRPSPVSRSLLDLLLDPQADWISPAWRRQFGGTSRRV